MSAIRFPPMSGHPTRKVYCVTAPQQWKLQEQMPGIDVHTKLRELADEYAREAAAGAVMPPTANKYWKDILSRIATSSEKVVARI